MWRWLHESWTVPDSAAQTPARPPIDSGLVLTTEAVTQLATFWKSFLEEPDSIRRTAGENLKEVFIPVGQELMSLMTVDVAALAAKYPSISADLRAARLTARQAEACRLALISAKATEILIAEGVAEPLTPTSVSGQNVAFYDTHEEARQVLDMFADTEGWK
jgi:hypothetical protein